MQARRSPGQALRTAGGVSGLGLRLHPCGPPACGASTLRQRRRGSGGERGQAVSTARPGMGAALPSWAEVGPQGRAGGGLGWATGDGEGRLGPRLCGLPARGASVR